MQVKGTERFCWGAPQSKPRLKYNNYNMDTDRNRKPGVPGIIRVLGVFRARLF
jgi:hypothetical protein